MVSKLLTSNSLRNALKISQAKHLKSVRYYKACSIIQLPYSNFETAVSFAQQLKMLQYSMSGSQRHPEVHSKGI